MTNSQIIAAVALWFNGSKSRVQAAANIKAGFSSRDKAKAALMPAIAKQYGADVTTRADGSVVWAGAQGKGSKATMAAKFNLNSLLRMAFVGKKTKVQSKKSPIAGVVKALVKLTDTQFDRAIAQAKAARKAA